MSLNMPQTRKRKTSATESNNTEGTPAKRVTRSRKTATKATTQPKGKSATTKQNNSTAAKEKIHQGSQAKKNIFKQRDDIVKEIDKEFKTRLPRVDRNAVMEELPADLVGVLPWMRSSPASARKTQTYPQLMLRALEDLRGHVGVYEKMVKQDTGIKAPNWMRWKQDAQDLENMSQNGLQMATKIINHVVMPDVHQLPTKPGESESGVEEVAWELIEEALPRTSNDIWGKIAQGHVKAFTELLKVLPVEE